MKVAVQKVVGLHLGCTLHEGCDLKCCKVALGLHHLHEHSVEVATFVKIVNPSVVSLH